MKLLILAPIVLAAFLAGRSSSRAQEAKPTQHAAFTTAELVEHAQNAGLSYYPFLNRTSLSVGLYRLPANGTDGQGPHELDEVYYVIEGRSRFTAGAGEYAAEPGSVIFVAAGVPHRFHDIEQDLVLAVFFSKAKPEGRDEEGDD